MTTPPETNDLLAYVDASPTPYHAVARAVELLSAAGFQTLREQDPWTIQPGGRYLVTRNDSTLVALIVGQSAPADAGFRLLGAHTDSPNLRLKPHAPYTKDGYQQLGVEVYGGVLLHTWLDRDLALAGRVVLRDDPQPRLLNTQRPIARVPNLAIHLYRELREKGLKLNAQTHMPPLLGLDGDPSDPRWFEAWLAAELDCDADAILSWDLMFHDSVPSTVAGLQGDFIHAPRLDNLASCHAGLAALLHTADASPDATCGIALYDHEEVGSTSAEGAGSPFLERALERVTLALGGNREDLLRACAHSLFVSADMAHAIHPNYADRHEPRHQPKLNHGPVIKVNANQRYATNADTSAHFARLAARAQAPTQTFVTRTDMGCGSTIGPITAARLGIPTVDVGNPMLSMHSIREMAGAHDHPHMIATLRQLFA